MNKFILVLLVIVFASSLAFRTRDAAPANAGDHDACVSSCLEEIEDDGKDESKLQYGGGGYFSARSRPWIQQWRGEGGMWDPNFPRVQLDSRVESQSNAEIETENAANRRVQIEDEAHDFCQQICSEGTSRLEVNKRRA